ncbi:hypothetical protein C8R46DRAFT_1034367 [Mycena filopes]|nr:hypothetical protein C8R46DRAFT_1034367 [Mycena filopes]
MKRKRPPPTLSDPEGRGSSAWSTCAESTSRKGKGRARSPSWDVPTEKPRKRQKAIPDRMRHMRNNVWGDRWMHAIPPSTAGSQQGELDASGNYTVSKSPPPAYRTTPLPSPVGMTPNSSSPTPHHVSSNCKPNDDPAPLPVPPQSPSPSFAEMFPLSDPFGDEIFEQFSKALDAEASSTPFEEGLSAFDLNAQSSYVQQSHNMTGITSSFPPPTSSDPLSNSMALLDLYSGGPLPVVSSNLNNVYPYHGATDWLPPPPTQHGLPANNVVHYPDGFSYPHSFSSPSHNVSDFPPAAWTPNGTGTGHPIPLVGGYSTPPMYTAHGSPYLGVPDGRYSPIYQRAGSGSPLAFYPASSPPYYCAPHPPLSPLTTRTASSGSLASLFAIDNNNNSPNSMESMIFSRVRGMSSASDYGDLNYSGAFTGSPGSGSSAYGVEGTYPGSSSSQTVPLPFNPPPPYPTGNFTFSYPS